MIFFYLILCLPLNVFGDSYNFLEIGKKSMSIQEPTKKQFFYINDFESDTHRWNATFMKNDVLYLEFLTHNDDGICYDMDYIEYSGLLNIAISRKVLDTSCFIDKFDPYYVTYYKRHVIFQKKLYNYTNVVLFINHEMEPYVLSMGKKSSFDILEILTFTWNTAKIQGWSSHYSLGYNLIIAFSIAFGIQICFRGNLIQKLILFSYIGNMIDKLYQYNRFNITLAHNDILVFYMIHITIPAAFIIFQMVYMNSKKNIWLEYSNYNISLHTIIYILLILFSFLLYQPGVYMDILFKIITL